MRYLPIILITFTFLSGCITKTYTVDKVEPWSEEQCKDVPKVWWGEKGDDPSNNPIWKCYRWTIEQQ